MDARLPDMAYAPIDPKTGLPHCVEGNFGELEPTVYMLLFTIRENEESYFRSVESEYEERELAGYQEIGEYLLNPGWPDEVLAKCEWVLVDPIDDKTDECMQLPRLETARRLLELDD